MQTNTVDLDNLNRKQTIIDKEMEKEIGTDGKKLLYLVMLFSTHSSS
jgi:hypothetical protein